LHGCVSVLGGKDLKKNRIKEVTTYTIFCNAISCTYHVLPSCDRLAILSRRFPITLDSQATIFLAYEGTGENTTFSGDKYSILPDLIKLFSRNTT
jgi:hypothetical protein